jgi:ABC-type branched-subunit amino acid transport system substrate-binding protein
MTLFTPVRHYFSLRSRSRFIDAIATVLIAIVLIDASSAAAQSPAKISLAFSLTGSAVTFGQPSFDGATLALEEANAERGAVRIEVDVHDDESNPDKAREIARQIGNGDALVVVGPATTPIALAAGPVYAQSSIACIGTTTTGDSVTDSATFFRAIFSTSDGGEALVNYLRYILGGIQATVIYKDDGYGQPFSEGVRRGIKRLGMNATYIAYGTPSEAEEAAYLAANDPAHPAVILGAISEATEIVAMLRRQNMKAPILASNAIAGDFFAAGFAKLPEEREHPGFFTNNVYAATPLLFDSANAEQLAFLQRFRARFGKEPSYITVQAYDAMRLAIAAVRSTAKAQTAPGVKARREAVRAYLASLDGPANAVAGINGPLWFTPNRGRQQALRMGRFNGRQFESAPSQLVPVRHPEASEIAGGTAVEMGNGSYARRQQVVYSGLFLNEVSRVDVAQSTFTADFYLWMRFARGADTGIAVPTEIEFPNLVRGSFEATRTAAQGDLDDGTTYRLWQVRGDFKNDFDLHRYPGDRQTLAIGFFNARAATDRIVYVLDQRSFAGLPQTEIGADSRGDSTPTGLISSASASEARFGGGVAPSAFRNLTQWIPVQAQQRRDNLVTLSALGDPRLVGLERMRELSGFNLTVELRRRIGTTLAKTLLPLGLMALIMFASLYFPTALVKEKVTVAITGALSGAVLLAAINAQLGNVGYVIAVEYGFYAFFLLCLLCIVSVLAAERLRAAGRGPAALVVEQGSRLLYAMAFLGTAAFGWYVLTQS